MSASTPIRDLLRDLIDSADEVQDFATTIEMALAEISDQRQRRALISVCGALIHRIDELKTEIKWAKEQLQ